MSTKSCCPVAAALLLVAACGTEPPPTGSMRVMITSNAQVGAVVFEITGAAIGEVAPTCPTPRCDVEQSGSTYRVVVAGSQATGHAATVTVSNLDSPIEVTIVEAAKTSADNYALFAPGQVTASLVPIP